MRWTTLRTLLASLMTCATLSLALAEEAKEDGFTPLVGTDLKGWKFYLPKSKEDSGKTFRVEDGVLISSGKPNGYCYTDKSLSNYVLRYDWRFKRPEGLTDDSKFPGNSGLLLHIQEPGKQQSEKNIWPKCVEVQGRFRDHGKLFFMGVKGSDTYDQKAKDRVVKKVGEWNSTEVTVKGDGSYVVVTNGEKINTGKSTLTEGPIGFQSEGTEIHFRNIRYKPIK